MFRGLSTISREVRNFSSYLTIFCGTKHPIRWDFDPQLQFLVYHWLLSNILLWIWRKYFALSNQKFQNADILMYSLCLNVTAIFSWLQGCNKDDVTFLIFSLFSYNTVSSWGFWQDLIFQNIPLCSCCRLSFLPV